MESFRKTIIGHRHSFPRCLPRAFFFLAFFAGGLTSAYAAGSDTVARVFLWLAVILLVARIASLVERLGQPAVLGELLAGMVLGSAGLAGIGFLEPAKNDPVINFFAELGVVLLLFQIGMESSIESMRKVGVRAAIVGVIGVVTPFVLGACVAGPWLMPDADWTARLFLGAALTATSVGITGRVFHDAGGLHLPAAQVVLGAAVIDDVLGLIILAVVSALAIDGKISVLSIGWIVVQAAVFLIGALAFGQWLMPRANRLLARINSGMGMKSAVVISFCLILAYIAHCMGLAPIIGAFAAGLVLERSHFAHFEDPAIQADVRSAIQDADSAIKQRVDKVLERYAERHHVVLVEGIGHLLIPIFFVVTGMKVNVATLFEPGIFLSSLLLTVVAIIGKLFVGIAVEKNSRWLVAWGMVPRGEVGLIFAVVGKDLGVVSDQLFSIIVMMIILTTMITPSILQRLLRSRVA